MSVSKTKASPLIRIGMRTKLISIFILIKVIPLLLLSWFLFYQLNKVSFDIDEKISTIKLQIEQSVSEVGDRANQDSIKSLDSHAQEEIEQLTRDTSQAIAQFLYAIDDDIRQASIMAKSESVFKEFLSRKTKKVVNQSLWVLSEDNQFWLPKKQDKILNVGIVAAQIKENKKEFHYQEPNLPSFFKPLPLFLEMTFVDLKGMETLKVTTSKAMTEKLQDISNPSNTYIHAENYFNALKNLKPNEIYVSNVIGAYVPSKVIGAYTPATTSKKGLQFEPEKSAYAGKENPLGKRFQGLVRWATPVVEKGEITGYVTLALDHTHIMEFTDHLLPTKERFSEVSDAASGNYAFMWDNLGRNISHPRDYFIVGYNPENGEPVMPWLEDTLYDEWQASSLSTRDFIATAPTFRNQGHDKKPSIDMIKKGHLALDCRFLNFAPQCAGWNNLTQYGGSGSFVIFWSKLWKLTTAATIPYFTGQYAHSSRGFGFVTIGANVDEFHSPAVESKQQVDIIIAEQTHKIELLQNQLTALVKQAMNNITRDISISTGLLSILVILIAIWMASYLTNQITRLINGVNRFEQGELNFRLPVLANDEMGKLSTSFNNMAEKIEASFGKIQSFADKLSLKNTTNQNLMTDMEQEILQRESAQKTLRHLAYYDSLTQLPNRSQLNIELSSIKKQSIQKHESLALLFIDLDGFKYINDSFGHSLGDALLLSVANRLQNHSREQDFVARLGGDEFTIIVRDIEDNSLAEKVAQKIVHILSMEFTVEEHDIFISASVGITLFNNHDIDIDAIMKSADVAMYHAKDKGKDGYQFCTDELRDKNADRVQIASDLRKAISNNEFVLLYQPKVDTQSSDLIGLEALIRWHHPERGLIPPDYFIPIAEETGLILQIGEWVLKEACEQTCKWIKQGLNAVPVAVNVSARQFSQSTLTDFIMALLDENKLDSRFLEIELTETLVMQQPDQTIRVLQTLHDLGIISSIDDFGTGYSSLAYLKQFPVDILKIDRSFIHELEINAGDTRLVKAMINMAHSMGLKVIAEGVENKEQQQILSDIKCDYLQGYLFSRPLSSDDIEQWLA